jgi:hypothetical protein
MCGSRSVTQKILSPRRNFPSIYGSRSVRRTEGSARLLNNFLINFSSLINSGAAHLQFKCLPFPPIFIRISYTCQIQHLTVENTPHQFSENHNVFQQNPLPKLMPSTAKPSATFFVGHHLHGSTWGFAQTTTTTA